MSNNSFVFFSGLVLLILFGWYVLSDADRAKRIVGTILTILLVSFCITLVIPPFDVRDQDGKLLKAGKIPLGLDLQGGTSFLIQLMPAVSEGGETRSITPDMVE